MSTEAGTTTGSGTTYVVVDGENIDATLGTAILGARPAPDQRPRWERVLAFAQQQWGQDVKGLFFLNASNGSLPMSFVQALLAIGFQPIPLSGEAHEKVVDIGIKRTLEAIAQRSGDVMLVSHDGDFAAELATLVDDDSRRTGLIAFREFTSTALSGLIAQGLHAFDLEHDVQAFNVSLPRVRIIPLEQFDPTRYL
ncbi:nuclease [Cellulomonas sp. A375-1]|uniref:NYN domain-containing protein n=1 Tax=unclassified Cellulomonas TaxID=2620175 RepID=UPI00065271BB|nr:MULTISPECIES: NYN domain-containing protein [unclassified Cellulomonas]KMM44526.1 nuclease [Cellulomonas sp. A375-1]MCR6704001.1 NYN domain-containing protein [Cellulomonas sp.]